MAQVAFVCPTNPGIATNFNCSLGKTSAFKIAAYLTEPVCKVQELSTRLSILEEINPKASKVGRFVEQFFTCMLIGAFAFLALVATVPGIIIRGVAASAQSEPYIYMQGDLNKQISDRPAQFTIFSHNLCAPAGHYSITDGGVMPWAFRMDRLAENILKQHTDIFCGYELSDTLAAFALYEKLKGTYCHFYFNMGPRAVGVSSGLFVASKFPIKDPKFVEFKKKTLVGRTQFAAKGAFAFQLNSNQGVFARVVTTHPQHSEVCSDPTKAERDARESNIFEALALMEEVKNVCSVLTGDLNMDDQEYQWTFLLKDGYIRDNVYSPQTWGGDGWCAKYMKKTSSGPQNLDYTLLKVGSAKEIKTVTVPTGFHGNLFLPEALSDHLGIKATITL